MQRLREARGIPEGSAIPVFIDRRTTMRALWGRVPHDADRSASWPGPLTLIGKPQLSLAWTAGVSDAVALRMPMHPWMLQLIAELGPLAGTGAPRPDEPPPTSLATCDEQAVAIGLDGGQLPGGPVSTVVDLRRASRRCCATAQCQAGDHGGAGPGVLTPRHPNPAAPAIWVSHRQPS